mgnify:CR=1 FL=1
MITIATTEPGATSADVGLFFDGAPAAVPGSSSILLAANDEVHLSVSDDVEKMEQQSSREVMTVLEDLRDPPPAVKVCGTVTIRKGTHAVTVVAWKMPLAVHTGEEATDVGMYMLEADAVLRGQTPSVDIVHVVSADVGVNVLPALRAALEGFEVSGDAVDSVWYVYSGDNNTRYSLVKPHDNLSIAPALTKKTEWCLMDLLFGWFK